MGKVELDDQFKNTLKEGVIMPQVGNYVVNYKNIIVKTSDGSVITGKTNIDAFGRLTEYLKQGTDKFITVFSEEAGDKSKQVNIVTRIIPSGQILVISPRRKRRFHIRSDGIDRAVPPTL